MSPLAATPDRQAEPGPRRRFFFVTDRPPSRGDPGGVVLLRHLERLRSAGEVCCISIAPPDTDAAFPQITVPLRRAGFMPARSWLPGSAAINEWQKVRYILRRTGLGPHDYLVSCLHEREHAFSRRLSRMSGAKLTCLLHDLWPDAAGPAIRLTLKQANHVLAVSPSLAELARDFAGVPASVLPPIGEDPLPPPVFEATKDALGIAGSLAPHYGEIALRFGAPVEAIGWRGNPPPGLRAVPRFAHNREALTHLRTRCRALLVCQPRENPLYCRYSFPSRFVDFSQTGLPVLLVAPPESNLGRWAAARRWRLWARDENDADTLRAQWRSLSDPAFWAEESARVRELAEGEFNAGKIHQTFVEALLGSRRSLAS